MKRAWITSWVALALASISGSIDPSIRAGASASPSLSKTGDRAIEELTLDDIFEPNAAPDTSAILRASASPPAETNMEDLQIAWSLNKTRNTCPAHSPNWETAVRDQLPENLPSTDIRSSLTVRRQITQLVSSAMSSPTEQETPRVAITNHDRTPVPVESASEFWHVWQQLYANAAQSLANDNQSFHLWVEGQLILRTAELPWLRTFAESLETAMSEPDFDPAQIQPILTSQQPAIQMDARVVLPSPKQLVNNDTENPELVVIEWVNNLRQALGVKPLTLVEAQERMYELSETDGKMAGLASWYGPYFHGRLTANGETYDQEAFTAAHKSLPFNTFLKLTNQDNGLSVIIRINDRGPYIPPRTLDLSRGVARCIQGLDTGVVEYDAVFMSES